MSSCFVMYGFTDEGLFTNWSTRDLLPNGLLAFLSSLSLFSFFECSKFSGNGMNSGSVIFWLLILELTIHIWYPSADQSILFMQSGFWPTGSETNGPDVDKKYYLFFRGKKIHEIILTIIPA